jgi:tRNA dimethylallyltransferase
MDVLEATGRPLSAWQEMSGKPALAGLHVAKVVLAPPREILFERTHRRFEAMVKEGALEEARALLDLDPTLSASKALGLRELCRHLKGEISLESAIAEAQLSTRNYVKRQLTWFRNRMKEWNWLESGDLSNFIASTERESS